MQRPSSLESDRFDGPALDTRRWTVVDPAGDCAVSVSDGHLVFEIPGGRPHDVWTSGNQAPRVVQSIADGDFGLEVKFDSRVHGAFQMQGVLVAQDAGHFVRFDFFSDGQRLRAFAATFTGGVPAVRSNVVLDTDAAPLRMRVERVGDVWTQRCSTDGSSWRVLTSFTHALAVGEVGVFAGNAGNTPPATTVAVDHVSTFEVERPEPPAPPREDPSEPGTADYELRLPIPPGPVPLDVLPPGRRTVWNPGIYGGVPPDTAEVGRFPNGVGPATRYGETLMPSGRDDRDAIQTALRRASKVATKAARRYVRLGPGTFEVDGRIDIPSYVILRGTLGASGRRTVVNQTSSGTLVALAGGSGERWGRVVKADGVQDKGSAVIEVADASRFEVGDIIAIDHASDGSCWGPADGDFARSFPGTTGRFIGWTTSLWYQRQPYSAGHGVRGLFPDSDSWRHISQRCEVLAKSGNTLTIYDPDAEVCGSPLHTTFYNDPEVYRAGGERDVVRYAGLEDLEIRPSGTDGQRVVVLQQAYCCWVSNIEIDGSANTWSGRHIQLYGHTYRCEIRDSYFHESSNYHQGGNAYGIVVGGSDNLVENNIAIDLNKPIVCENTEGGNVIAYNYVDNAVIGSLAGSWQEAAISTHASFCHWDLFEGNHTPNITIDSTHGNNGWGVAFRNWCTGRNSNGHASAYERAISVDGWNWEVSSIGNVLWRPGSHAEIDFAIWHPGLDADPVFGGPEHVYLLGSNAWDPAARRKRGADFGDDGMAAEYFHRHLDFDYETRAQYDNPANPASELPPSLYSASKPAFFGDRDWPWVDPAGSSHAERVGVLPAKARYDAGDA